MLDVAATRLDVAVDKMVDELSRKGVIQAKDVPKLLEELQRREELATTAIGQSLGRAARLPRLHPEADHRIARLQARHQRGRPGRRADAVRVPAARSSGRARKSTSTRSPTSPG